MALQDAGVRKEDKMYIRETAELYHQEGRTLRGNSNPSWFNKRGGAVGIRDLGETHSKFDSCHPELKTVHN